MATTKIINDLIDLNQTGNTTALKGCVGTNAQQPATPTISVQYLVVGGGGGGGGFGQAGGGGAGGLSTATIGVPNNTDLSIVVGQGGAGGTGALPATGANGQDSGFYQIQGQGGGGSVGHNYSGLPGGSGGGSGTVYFGSSAVGGNGVSGQGNAGGTAVAANYALQYNGSGGGGAGGPGAGGNNAFGYGGDGSDVVVLGIITQANAVTAGVGETYGAERNFAGGGGGGSFGSALGTGGNGGGGNGDTGDGANAVVSNGSPGTINTGGGGGGAGSYTSGNTGGSGGSGVVILKYANADVSSITIGGSLAGGITTGTTADCNYPVTATALYQLNDNATDTCLNYNLTEVGTPTYVAGKFGKAISFNGTSQGTTSTSALVSSPAMTISFWYNGNGIAAISTQYIIGAGINSSCQGPSVGYYNGGFFGIIIDSGNNVGSATGPTTVSTSSWNNVVFTWDGTTTANACKIYLNGALDVEFTSTSSASSIGAYTPFGIGQTGASVGTASYAEGLVDQVRIFPSALTADQVAMLYAENVGATKFDDGTNTTLVFKGGSGTINLTGSSVLGPKVGDLRTNTDQSSNTSISAMEHYMSTGWRVFTNTAPPVDIYYLVIAGGGGGGAGGAATGAGGGGGGGGYRNSFSTEYSGGLTSTESPIVLVTGSPYTVTVGAGGSAGSVGADSIFSTITSTGGGFGQTTNGPGGSGGSGGGGWGLTTWSPPPGPGLAVSPTQGFNGGYQDGAAPGAGGGGAGAQGVNINTGNYAAGGNAGAGLTSNIDTLGIGRAGGGGGGSYSSGSGSTGGGTASDGGGTGGGSSSTAGTTNKGGGGGGGNGGDAVSRSGAAGGSGVVILRYPTASVASFSITGTINTPTPVISGTDSIITFTTIGTGTITFS